MFLALKRMFAVEDNMGSGTVYKSVNKQDLQKLQFIFPSEDILKSFSKIAITLNEKYKVNSEENQTLTQLRDTLLPKLISGEVHLKGFEKEITAAL
tara:strand:- start:122 stop:409 length:288 start_codon:yes stop_codon:yes gene_type:complete